MENDMILYREILDEGWVLHLAQQADGGFRFVTLPSTVTYGPLAPVPQQIADQFGREYLPLVDILSRPNLYRLGVCEEDGGAYGAVYYEEVHYHMGEQLYLEDPYFLYFPWASVETVEDERRREAFYLNPAYGWTRKDLVELEHQFNNRGYFLWRRWSDTPGWPVLSLSKFDPRLGFVSWPGEVVSLEDLAARFPGVFELLPKWRSRTPEFQGRYEDLKIVQTGIESRLEKDGSTYWYLSFRKEPEVTWEELITGIKQTREEWQARLAASQK